MSKITRLFRDRLKSDGYQKMMQNQLFQNDKNISTKIKESNAQGLTQEVETLKTLSTILNNAIDVYGSKFKENKKSTVKVEYVVDMLMLIQQEIKKL